MKTMSLYFGIRHIFMERRHFTRNGTWIRIRIRYHGLGRNYVGQINYFNLSNEREQRKYHLSIYMFLAVSDKSLIIMTTHDLGGRKLVMSLVGNFI